MEYQTITELIEALKMAGKVYNDADFARKTGLKQSFVSEMKSGKKPFTGATRKKIEETFPDFFNGKTVPLQGELTLSDLARMVTEHDRSFHDQMERLMDAMGIPKKEKIA